MVLKSFLDLLNFRIIVLCLLQSRTDSLIVPTSKVTYAPVIGVTKFLFYMALEDCLHSSVIDILVVLQIYTVVSIRVDTLSGFSGLLA